MFGGDIFVFGLFLVWIFFFCLIVNLCFPGPSPCWSSSRSRGWMSGRGAEPKWPPGHCCSLVQCVFLGFSLLERRSESCPGQELQAWFWGHRCLHGGSCAEITVGSLQALLPRARLSRQLTAQSCAPQQHPAIRGAAAPPCDRAAGWALFLGKLPRTTAFPGPALLHGCALTHPQHHPERVSSAASIHCSWAALSMHIPSSPAPLTAQCCSPGLGLFHQGAQGTTC